MSYPDYENNCRNCGEPRDRFNPNCHTPTGIAARPVQPKNTLTVVPVLGGVLKSECERGCGIGGIPCPSCFRRAGYAEIIKVNYAEIEARIIAGEVITTLPGEESAGIGDS